MTGGLTCIPYLNASVAVFQAHVIDVRVTPAPSPLPPPRRYTQYIPLSIYELQSWLGTPSIYVLDCSSAGLIVNVFRAFMDQRGGGGVSEGAGGGMMDQRGRGEG